MKRDLILAITGASGAAYVRRVMEGCYKLSVPLKVDISLGPSWTH